MKTAESILTEYLEEKGDTWLTRAEKQIIIGAMKEYAEQALDLASEKAVCLRENEWDDYLDVDKQSILDLKSQLL